MPNTSEKREAVQRAAAGTAYNSIGDYYARKDREKAAAAKALEAAQDVLDGLKAHGVTYGPDYDDARAEVRRLEQAYDLAAYVGD